MKRSILSVLLSAAVLFAGGCAGKTENKGESKKVEIPPMKASEIITLDQAKQAVNGEYELKADGEDKTEGNKSSILYKSEPTGAGYPVEVTLYQPIEGKSASDVEADYEEMLSKRPKALSAEDMGSERAFIAYPSIHIYQKGYHFIITAGGGSDDRQQELLKNLARTGLENLNAYIEKKQ